MVTQLVGWGLTFLVTMYLPRYVGDVGLGAITLAGSLASIYGLFIALGASTALVKEIARDHSRTGELLIASLATRTVLGLAFLPLAMGAAHLLGYGVSLQRIIFAALCVVFLGMINEALGSCLRGLEEIPRQSASLIVEKCVSSVVTIALVIAKAPIWVIVASGLISTVISIGINLTAFRPYWPAVKRVSWPAVTFLIVGGMPFFTRAIFTAVYGQSDALLLSKLSSVAAIGWYGLAKRLGGTTMMIPVALTTAMLPTLSRLYKSDMEGFKASSARLFNLIFILVVPFAILLIMAPAQILSILHYPPAFQASIPVLVIMGWAIILWFLSAAVGTVLIACDRQAVFSKITGVSALISVPLCGGCILLTEHTMHNGAIGAMFSDAVIEAYMVIAYIFALPKGLFDWRRIAILARATVAALPLVISFYFIHSKQDLLWLLPALLLYIPLCWALKCLTPEDKRMLLTLAGRFRKPSVKGA
jgi:O-antigen/teichoic acid export membrane protein